MLKVAISVGLQNMGESVQQFVKAHRKRLVDRLMAMIAPANPEELRVHLDAVIDALLSIVDRYMGLMGKAYKDHAEELRHDTDARKQRDKILEEYVPKTRDARDAIKGAHGDSGLRLAGMEHPVPTQSDVFHAYLDTSLEKVGAEGFAFGPTVSAFKAAIDPIQVVTDLAPGRDKLSGALTHIDDEFEETESAMIAKRDARDEYKVTVRLLVNVFFALFLLVGMKEEAKRVRHGNKSTDKEPKNTGENDTGDDDTGGDNTGGDNTGSDSPAGTNA